MSLPTFGRLGGELNAESHRKGNLILHELPGNFVLDRKPEKPTHDSELEPKTLIVLYPN